MGPTSTPSLCVCDIVSLPLGNGGGVAILVPAEPQPEPQPESLVYWAFSHSSLIYITNSTFTNNTASSQASSGGGLYLTSGGLLAISGSSFCGNYAGLFGGGIGLGSSNSLDTCELQLLAGTTFTYNAAGHGGAQLHMGCAADMLVEGLSMMLTMSGTQVRADLCFGLVLDLWTRAPW
jgi:hypothetical protein